MHNRETEILILRLSSLRRWRKGQEVEVLEAHKAAIQAIIKFPSGELVTDTVRGLAAMPSLGVLSASHDGSIRLWELSGQVLLEMVGHTAIVYSVDAHASGLIVSGSEGRFAKIWKGIKLSIELGVLCSYTFCYQFRLVKTGLMMAYHVLFLMEFNMIMCLMIDIGDGEPVRKLPYNRSGCAYTLVNLQSQLHQQLNLLLSMSPRLDFVIVKNGSYEQFPWGKSSFEKLIVTWRQDFLVEKQLYSMGGMSHVLNVWMYECCSEVDSAIAERVGNVIPRIFNWKVVGIKVKYEKFMGGIFSKFVYNNIRPTHEKVQSLDLQMIEGFELNDDEYGFSPKTVAGRSGLLSDASASQHTKRRRTVRFDFTIIKEQVYQKTPSSVSTKTVSTQKTPSSDLKHVHAEKTTPSSSSKLVCHDNSNETWDEMKLFFQSYVDTKFNFLHDLMVKQHQESNEKIDKQHAELIQMLKHNNQINEKDVEGCCEDITTARLGALVKFVVNQNSANPNVGTPSTVHINKDQMGVEGISADIGPATLKSLVTVVKNLKPDSANVGTSTMQHIDVIFYYLRKKSKLRNDQDYRFTTTNCFFKNYIVETHSNYYEDDTNTVITTQQDYAQSVDVVLNEDATTNIIKGYCMSSGLPWHQVDEVYVPINCNNKFHWVLAAIVLKDRRICVYDSLSSLRNMKSINEINKLVAMLPTYLYDKLG
ncbi:hypothetical protein FXO38_31543 [Capsicum annuum]|nr:hypothetical protein FXO38_31543 [Capsicum annuum]